MSNQRTKPLIFGYIEVRLQLNPRIHRNAAHRLRRRARAHGCTLFQGETGLQSRSFRSTREACELCLREPSHTTSRSPPQERPNIGNKSSDTDKLGCKIGPMPSAPKPVTDLQQLQFSSSFFYLTSASHRFRMRALQRSCLACHLGPGPRM